MYTKNGLIITNTYPVFVKAFTDNEKGLFLSTKLSNIKRDNYENNKTYMDDFNIELNKFIKDCYDNSEKFYLGKQINNKIKLCFYKALNGLFLYTLKTNKYLILMNYGEFKKGDVASGIPLINDYNLHVKEYVKDNTTYLVTNTYDSFIKYADINLINPIKKINEQYFDEFLESIVCIDLKSNKEIRRVRAQFYKEYGLYTYYKYIVADGIILIVDYFNSPFSFKND